MICSKYIHGVDSPFFILFCDAKESHRFCMVKSVKSLFFMVESSFLIVNLPFSMLNHHFSWLNPSKSQMFMVFTPPKMSHPGSQSWRPPWQQLGVCRRRAPSYSTSKSLRSRNGVPQMSIGNITGWWFQTFFIFHIWDNPSY